MPVSCNPHARANFYLSTDLETPHKDRPAFTVKFLTAAELDRHAEAIERLEAAADAGDRREFAEAIWNAGTVGITGWKNVKGADGQDIPFNRDALLNTLTVPELWELVRTYPSAVRLLPEDFRNFASPSPTAAVASAGEGQTEAAAHQA